MLTVRADERLAWDAGSGLVPVADRPPGEPAVVDSWLVADERVRDLPLHEERFLRASTELLPDLPAAAVHDFLDAVRRWQPGHGRWFPRVEAYAGARPRLALWPRPAPEPDGEEVTLWIPPGPDPRRHPTVKGPDLRVLAALRERARELGADDALLHDRAGTALESAHSALVWWRGGTLCVPAGDLPVLPSVTRIHLERLAACWRVPVRRERISVTELTELETWSVNALHGLRPVRAWVDAAGRTRAAARISARAEEWRQAVSHRAVLPVLPAREQPCAP
ncbi:aminotransferase class IV [Nonomuraea sp. NPDC050790]|uniref:aminotransferase class IV n=1 Tax=Nonomuraea sp. NPDC050790 TaxID=3364371 RepID=UPI00379E99B0